MICPSCGRHISDAQSICTGCGRSLHDQAQPSFSPNERLRLYLPSALCSALPDDSTALPSDLDRQCLEQLARLLESVSTHLPPQLLEQLLSDPVPGRAGGTFIYGTLLFADISGFTAMSERLSRSGREGAEEITSIVNRYFTSMLAILRDHNGELITFGGDALLGFFVDPDSATHATQSAIHMQASMGEFAETITSQGNFPLRMKVGVHSGRFFAARLGSARNMEYALIGHDVNVTAAIEISAQTGETRLDRSTLAAISIPVSVEPAPDHPDYRIVRDISAAGPQARPIQHQRTPLPTSLGDALRMLDVFTPFLPAGVLPRLASDPGALSLEGEHRLVAVLFANVHGLGEIVDGLGPGEEQAIIARLNRYFTAMEQAIHQFGGVINKMDLNDDGDKLLAFFGAPVAHEDDAERAVRAALAMQQALQTLEPEQDLQIRLDQQIGIAYGYVFSGYIGSSWRNEYTVMGDEVNLAARLMSVAEPGGIALSQSVQRKTQVFFESVPRGEVRLKGKSQPIPVFSLTGPRATPSASGLQGLSSPLVGREQEWRELQSVLDAITSGTGRIVSLIGDAGLGKSRLLLELSNYTRGLFVTPDRWIEGQCLSYTEVVPYWPFQKIMRDLLGIRLETGAAQARLLAATALEHWIGPSQAEEHLPYLATLLNLRPDDGWQERLRYLDAEALQRRTFVAVSTLLEAVARAPLAPLVIVLDDIHWIDRASMTLLEHVLPLVERVPLMFVLLYRPERDKPCWAVRDNIRRALASVSTEINLRPLEQHESSELLLNLVPAADWPIALFKRILGPAEGNPLYVEEVVRALIDEGALIQTPDGQWQLTRSIETIRVPDSLQGVMMARLDQLEESSRWTAHIASVIGRTFSAELLASIHPDDAARLRQHLISLQQHEIAREITNAPESIYQFMHAVMHEVCYGTLLARRARLFHARLAEHLERQHGATIDDAGTIADLIAYHAFAGHDWPRALRYHLIAGRQAQRLFANQEAIEDLRKALHSATFLPAGDTVEARKQANAVLGELLVTTGGYEPALEHLTAALDLAQQSDDPDTAARACRWLARLYELRGEYEPAFAWIDRGLSTLDGRETAEAAELLLISGLVHSRQANGDVALFHCRNSLRIAEQLGELVVRARAHNLFGHITLAHGSSTTAIEHFQQAFMLYRQAGDLIGEAVAENQIANACFNLGRWDDAEQHYRQARDILDRMGDTYNRAIADNNLGEIALNQGRLDEALNHYQEALSAFERIGGSPWMLGAIHNNLGAAYVRRGDIASAREHLHQGQDYFEQAQARDWLAESHRHLAEAALHNDEFEEATTQAQRALALAREVDLRNEQGIDLRVLADILLAQGRAGEAILHIDASLAILQEVADEYQSARTQVTRAHALLERGDVELARATLDHVTPIFQSLRARPDLDTVTRLRAALDEYTNTASREGIA